MAGTCCATQLVGQRHSVSTLSYCMALVREIDVPSSVMLDQVYPSQLMEV